MEGASYAEQLLYNIQFDLCNIQILKPGQFVQQLLCFPLGGLEERVLLVLRECMHQFQNERAIMKYIYIIDKLTKVPSFLPAIQAAIVDIYSELFVFLLQQKCSTEIEQLKILRKYWVGKLHPYYLNQIKEIILQRTSIDIDCGFKAETINSIKQYYATKLNLTSEEMAMHLPLTKKSEERYTPTSINAISSMSNQRYMVEAASIYPSAMGNTLANISNIPNINSISSINNINSMNSLNNLNSMNNMNNMGSMSMNATPYSGGYTHGYPHLYNHSSAYGSSFQPRGASYSRLPVEVSPGEEVKRKRLASEQTRVAAMGSMFEGAQPAPRKLQHKIEVIIDYKFMLSKLKRMNPFSCKECGLQFMTTESHESHRADHFKEKLSKNEKNNRQSKIGKLCSVQDWLDKSDLGFSLDQFYISIPKQEIQARLCHFCCAPLDIDFRNNHWVYTNAANVLIDHRLLTLHKSCHAALEAQTETHQ